MPALGTLNEQLPHSHGAVGSDEGVSRTATSRPPLTLSIRWPSRYQRVAPHDGHVGHSKGGSGMPIRYTFTNRQVGLTAQPDRMVP